MRKKLIVLTIIFTLISVFSFYYAFKEPKIVVDLEDPAYSYLPESAKEFIEAEAKKGNRILTEKNKEEKKVYLNPKYVEYLELSVDEKKKLEVIPQVYTYDYVSNKNTTSNFEPYYKLNNLTVKDQGTLGICWAFATISSIETNILTTGLSTNVVNFSERQLDYAMANAITEVDNPYAVSEIINNTPSYYELSSHELGSGASFVEAYKYLNMGISPIKEEIWGEYDNSHKTRSINEVLNYDNIDYQVSSYIIYGDNIYGISNYPSDLKTQFMDALKNHIINYGSLYIVTISPDRNAGSCFDSSRSYINYDESNLDCRNASYHAMAIVGWDDNYGSNGAWILKNSWGNSYTYLYMDYESDFFDTSGVIKVDAKNWDNGYNFTKTNKTVYSSNSYEVTYYKSADFKENLERINFVSWGIDATYNVYYKNGNGSYKLLKTVSNDLPGLITVDVTNVLLDKSSFTIKVTTNDGFIDGGLNAFTSNLVNEKYFEDYQFTNSSQGLPEQLIVRNVESGTKVNYYIFDQYGKQYNDVSSSYVINGTVDINYELPNLENGIYYLTLNDNFFNINVIDKIDLKVGSDYQLDYEVGSNLNVNNVSYTSSEEEIATVSDTGLVSALKPGKVTITLIINNIEIPVELIVFKESNVESLKILENDQTVYLSLLDEFDLHLDVVPTIYSKSDFVWTSSNDAIATVENGLVKFLSGGTVKISVLSDHLYDDITFNVIASTSNVTLQAEKTVIAVGEEIKLTHSSAFGYRYSTSNDEVVKVRNGNVTGLKNGTAWVYYKKGNDVSGILISVVDPETLVDLVINPNGGIYNGDANTSGNSLSTVSLTKPSYSVELTLINDNSADVINIKHQFAGFNLLGYGTLNKLDYTFGFAPGTLTAIWNYQSYTLPIPEKEGMTFVGWYKDSEFTELFGRNLKFVPEENMTLYAKFTDALIGDINNDSEIDITDLVILRKSLALLVELHENELLLADINHDGNVDITDLVILRKYLAGLEELT